MGCLIGQRLVEDGLPKLSEGLTIFGGVAAEDASSRRELFLGFAANPDLKLDGFLVFRLWIEPSAAGGPPSVAVANPRFDRSKAGGELSVSASGKGTLRIAPMWALGQSMDTVWRTCPDADLLEPFQGTFLAAQSLEPPLVPGDSFPLSDEARIFKVSFETDVHDQIERVAKGMALLDLLAERLGSAESRWVWQGQKLTAKALQDALRDAGTAQIAVRFDDGKTIGTSEDNFDAPVRFRLAVLDKYGHRKGVEVRIAPE